MTHTDEIVKRAIGSGLHTIAEVATIEQLTEASVAVSVEYLAKNGIIFCAKSSGRWWLSEGHSVIVRAA